MTATSETSGGLEAALEELFGTDPAEFTKTRDTLAKRLEGAGDEAAAAEVRGRRKPTQIAWVLNQLARRHPDEVAELVDVGRELLREQRKALRGDAKTSLRESIERQRKVIADLTRTASKMMTDLGVPATGLDEVASSLRAALVDPVVGARLEEGRFEKAPEPTAGFAGPLDVPVEAPKPPPERPAPKKHETAAEKKKAQAAEQKAQAKRIAEERAAAAKAAKADEAAKKKASAKARSERLAEERARKKAVAKALSALQAAEAAAKKHQAAATKARAEAEKIRKEAERADERATKLEAAAEGSAVRADEARKTVDELGG